MLATQGNGVQAVQRKNRIRGLALVGAVVCLILAVGIGSALAQEQEETGSTASVNAGQEAKELPGRRTATSNTFALPDGTLETRIYEVPVNYRDEKGDWQPIDESLRETASGSLVNGDNSFDAHLPEDFDEAPVKVTLGEQWVSQAPLGISTDPAELEGGIATYSTQSGVADIEFSGLANGLKETIELSGPAAPSTYHFRLQASAGVAPILLEDGSIEFRDENGDLVAAIPAPIMVDAAGISAPPDAVFYRLEDGSPQTWELAIEADPEWLNASERSWPVIIDPTVTIPSPALDCVIASGFSSSLCGTSGWPLLGVKAAYPSSGEDEYARTLLRFNLTGIPADASLTAATIGLYASNAAANVTKIDLYDVSRSWTSGVTWIKHSAGGGNNNNWLTPGGEFGKYMPTPTSLTPADRGGSQAGWWDFSSPALGWLVQRWLDGVTPNDGVLLKLADETPHVCCFERRVWWESSTGANKPYLSVQYITPAPSGSQITSPNDGTKTAKRFLLTSAWEHPGVTGVTFQYKADQGWKDIPGSQVIDQNNQTVTWPYSVPNFQDRVSRPLYWDASSLTGSNGEAKIQMRAVLSGDPGAGGYTKPVEAEIDRDAGGPKDATAEIGPGTVDLLTGNFTVSRTDVSIPTFNSALEFSRSFSSREAGAEANGVLGPGWKPASPVEEAGGSAWSKVKIESVTEEFEGESFTYKWAELIHTEGGALAFEENESGQFITPPEMSGYVLHRLNGTEIAFTDPEGNRTVFSNNGSGDEYWPISVAQTGGSGNKTRMIYDIEGNKRRLKRVIAPAAPGITCPDESATTTQGCRVLSFHYENAKQWGAPESMGWRLAKMTFYAAGHGGGWDVASFSYDAEGRLVAAWDPRISPALKETYDYGPSGQITTLTPAGLEPWTMSYTADPGGTNPGRLVNVKRATLDTANPTAQTTIAYGVPLSKEGGGPYDMEGKHVGQWGQEDLPTDATAIFPPDEVPAESPSSWTRATVYYMDAEGQLANVATSLGAGTLAPSITTTETDKFGNVVRELSAQNRLRALAAGAGSVAKSRELDTRLRYSKDGTELQEEEGPIHQVRLESSGAVVQARLHRSIQYDANFKYMNGTTTPSPGETKPHLPTTETTGALLANGSIVDKRSTEYRYNWTLRKSTETIADPGGSEETTSVTVYDSVSGLPTERRQPKDAAGGGAGTTKFIYYKNSVGNGTGVCESNTYAGLLCKTEPAAQPGTAGQPQLLVKKILSYNQLNQPLEVMESPGGGPFGARRSYLTYDAAGRLKTTEIIGGGVAVPKVETLYASSTGLPEVQQIICPGAEPGCDTQASTTSRDTLGRVTSYEDADGNTATTSYDFLGRPVTVNDGKGSQTYKYDSVTGLLVELEDSAAGVFTASYDADGNLTKRGLPNGLTAETIYDETGTAVDLSYTKASNCGLSCNWLDFALERSINGQILLEDGTLGKDEYVYDKLGRLVTARETPTGGACTTRTYKYDKDSNRTEMATIPGVGGTCSSTGGSTQKYCYDSADRLLGEAPTCEGVSYDNFGRITNLPAQYAGGKALATTYFSTDMVATQTQNGVTNSYQLDATLRHRQRLQAGGLEGTEIFHYAGPGDSPVWTERGSTWTRSIIGIGGELAAIQESGKEVKLQLTNLHGDVVATAAIDPAKTSLLSTFRHDEFGVPISGEAGRFGWLGGKQRRTELPSGVIQMGARSYVPSLGRFLTPDPILGGSDNPYDYANQDPVNNFDLAGTACKKKSGNKGDCRAKQKRNERKIRAIVENLRERLREARAKRSRSLVKLPGGVNVTFPWEKQTKEAINMATGLLKDVDEATSCDAGQALASTGAAWYGLRAVEGAKKVRAAAAKLSARFTAVAAALGVADVLGFC